MALLPTFPQPPSRGAPEAETFLVAAERHHISIVSFASQPRRSDLSVASRFHCSQKPSIKSVRRP
jgi:hypothetical protein